MRGGRYRITKKNKVKNLTKKYMRFKKRTRTYKYRPSRIYKTSK